MAYKKEINGILIDPPHNDEGNVNVHTNIPWLIEHGYTDMTDEEIAQYAASSTVDRADLEAAYTSFRAVCSAIGALIGNADFKGGFDEIAAFQNLESAQSQTGIMLALRWMAADKQCTYEAAKLGIGQPAWWNECWNNA